MRRIYCYLLTIILTVCLTGCGLDGCVSVNRNVVIGTTEVPGATATSGAESPIPLTPKPSFTAVPTVAPTDEPTPAPTEEPTAEPTEEPTEAPTLAPTAEPTEAPTITPTVVPTPKPTPTVTPLPTPTPVPKEGVFAVNSASDRYSFSKAFSQNPKTFEARFLCNASVTSTGEVITGNYKDLYSSGVYFGINPSGFPTLYINYNEKRSETFMIPVVVLQNGTHDVAFSIFDDKICGYLDGEMLLESVFNGELPNLTERPFSILGDDTANNSFWFRNGELLKLRIFSAPRTAEQIAADFSGEAPADPSEEPSPTDAADETVLVSFDFAASKEDASNNRNNIVPYWHEGEYMSKDSYKYTIAVVGDIQTLLDRHSDKVPGIFDYILDKKDEFNIKRTIFLGDLTENNSAEEWSFVREQVRRLDNGIPYSLVRGNHDGFIGEHHDLNAFGNYFGGTDSPYSAQYDGGYNGLINNTYKLAEIEGVKYLFMNLDFGPTDDVLKWAGEICSKHPDRQVVISLHSFLFCDGTLEDRLEPQEKYAVKYNSSANIWEKFASNHANVKMIIGGHTPDNNVVIRELTGKNGNKVTAILSDPQYVDKYMGGDGIVNLLHFGGDGTLVSIETVSTAKNKFYKAGNQIIF